MLFQNQNMPQMHSIYKQYFTNYEDTKKWVDSWISSKSEDFFQVGIRKLPERWEKVVASYGQYFE